MRKFVSLVVGLFFCLNLAYAGTMYMSGDFNRYNGNKWVRSIDAAPAGSTLIIIVSSPGGELSILGRVVNAVHRAHARGVKIHAKVTYAYSAAAMFICYADRTSYSSGATVMFHTGYYYDEAGNIHQFLDNNPRDPEYRFLRRIYSACNLTSNELYRIFHLGHDVWFRGSRLRQF